MATLVSLSPTSAAELFAQPADGYRYELFAGELVMMSRAGGRHGRIAWRIGHLLGKHVEEHSLGIVFAAETGFLIETQPDTVLAPDVAYLTKLKYETVRSEVSYIPLAPDLVVEVLSPSDRFSRVEAKALRWLDAGTPLVLLVDPENETIHAYRSRKQIEIYRVGETVHCEQAVAGWAFDVQDVFRRY